ncbi:MAG TPA: sugar ABC transporter substrate-binding protein [Thermodesulfobacteriota bacterium]|nr:sugar ABC transporter substrate-binding protein [Thermodesulfobacteriota bacterium]
MRKSVLALLVLALAVGVAVAGWAQTTKWGLPLNPFGTKFAVKPDGTPYKFACSVLFLGVDTLSQGEKLQKSLIERAGGKYIFFDPGLDPQKQIAWIEDLITVQKPDCIIFQSVNEKMLVPVVEKAWDAGIPSVIWDIDVNTDKKISFILHDFAGDKGSNQVGQYFVDRAKAAKKKLHILEIWGQRALQTSQDRHAGFHKAVDKSDLIKVMESEDSNWSPEKAADIVGNALTADPTINAIFSHGGEAPGVVNGLRSINRLFPLEHPKHVIVATNDIDPLVAKSIDEGLVDACGSHQACDLMDVATQVGFTAVVLKQKVPKRIAVPMYVITKANINSLKMLGLPTYPKLPVKAWGQWPPLNISELGIPTPTMELRKKLVGY